MHNQSHEHQSCDRLILHHLNEMWEKIQNHFHQEDKFMSKLTDWAAHQEADLSAISATLDSVVAGIKTLSDMITAFQNSPGALTPADQAALDSIQTAADALVAKSQAISTVPPAPPVPAV